LPNVGFLHTAEVHIDTFETLAQTRELSTEHRVHAHWLQQAASSGFDESLRDQVTRELHALRLDCDVVICTCSTLGELAAQFDDSRVFRVDAPMMALAAAAAASTNKDSTTLLAYCLESTRATSTKLLTDALQMHQQNQNADIQEVDCTAAWLYFEAGDNQRFGETIARQIEIGATNASKQVCSVVLAQASMTTAIPYLEQKLSEKTLSSPASAMHYAQSLVASANR